MPFEHKVAVDINFRFNIDQYKSKNIIFHKATSDEYFLNLHENEIFDLIYIDGLHHFQQTLRDFFGALEHSHDKTIIVIDDVYPHDVFSALTEKAVFYRSIFNEGNSDMSWHGDVFKTIFAIHDLCLHIDYMTIDREHGNPQTILFKAKRKKFKQTFKNLEEIERLNYFNFLDNLETLILVSEDEAFKIIKNFYKSFL